VLSSSFRNASYAIGRQYELRQVPVADADVQIEIGANFLAGVLANRPRGRPRLLAVDHVELDAAALGWARAMQD
jgi:hypothetical protein